MAKILTTTDYDKFKSVPGNRDPLTPAGVKHTNHLISLNSKENLLFMFPATVTKDGYLWDGQHRREACRAQGWEFPYIVSDKTLAELGDTIVALTNTAQKRWGILDFINYYTKHGKDQYVFLSELMREYKFSHTNILTLVTGASQAIALKKGNLSLYNTEDDKKIIYEMLDGYKLLREVVAANVFIHRMFVGALRTVFGTMSAEELKGEIIRSNTTLERKLNTTEYLRLLERIVNYRRQKENHIRFF